MPRFLAFSIWALLLSGVTNASPLTKLIARQGKETSDKTQYIQKLNEALQIDPSQSNKDRALEVSVREVDAVAVEFLLNNGANAQYISTLGKKRPLLHISLKWVAGANDYRPDPVAQAQIISLLLDGGANPSVKDSEGYTASDLTFYTRNGWRQNQAPLSAIVRLLKTHPYINGTPLAEILPDNVVARCLVDLIMGEADYNAYLWLKGLNPNLMTFLDKPLAEEILRTKSAEIITQYIDTVKPMIGTTSFKLIHTLGLKGLYLPFVDRNPSLLKLPFADHPLLLLAADRNPDIELINLFASHARAHNVDLVFKGIGPSGKRPIVINSFAVQITGLLIRSPIAFAKGIDFYLEGGWTKVVSVIPNHKDRTQLLELAIIRWFRENSETATGKDISAALARYRFIEEAINSAAFDYFHLITRINPAVTRMMDRLGGEFPRAEFNAIFGAGVTRFESVFRTSLTGVSCEDANTPND